MFPAIASLYDREAAAALARGAAAAYGGAAEMQAWAAAEGCGGCAVLRDEATDTLAFVAAAEQRAFVVFRGTRDLRNWITDIDVRRTGCGWAGESGGKPPHSRVEVHEGFARALESVWEPLAEAIGPMASGNRDLFFAGHSLGGALAMLACARWTAQGRAVSPLTAAGGPGAQRTERPTSWLYTFGQPRVGNAAWARWTAQGRAVSPLTAAGSSGAQRTERPTSWLYTFGQPRVGNAAWARWYDGRLRRRSFRIVHAEDVVARVPWLLGRFRHAGTEIFFDSFGVKHIDWPWWAKLPSDAAGLYAEWRRGPIALLGDHHVATYVTMLNADGGMKSLGMRSGASANGLIGPARGVPTLQD